MLKGETIVSGTRNFHNLRATLILRFKWLSKPKAIFRKQGRGRKKVKERRKAGRRKIGPIVKPQMGEKKTVTYPEEYPMS